MHTTDELRRRFNEGVVIDRHGFIAEGLEVDTSWAYNLIRFLHYALLDGMSCKVAEQRLLEAGYSPFETRTLIDEVVVFIEETLGVDLAAREASRNSTVTHCYTDMYKHMETLKQAATAARGEPVEFEGRMYDADPEALLNMERAMNTSPATGYWVDATNARNEEWDSTKLSNLYKVVNVRNAIIHEVTTKEKEQLRTWAEKGNLHELLNWTVPEFK